MTRGFVACSCLAALVTACGPDPAQRLRELQLENERLSAERDANAAFLAGVDEYVPELRAPGSGNISIHLTPAVLEKLAGDMLPLRLDARTFHRQLEGTIVVEKVGAFRFAPGNRLTCTAQLRGEKIRFTGKVPSFLRSEVARFQQGVAEGVTLALEARVFLERGSLEAHAHALKATLKRNSSPTSEGMLVDEINLRVLRTPFVFDVAIPEARARPTRALLTANHLVISYAR